MRRGPRDRSQARRRVRDVSSLRKCTRRSCPHPAVAALTCDYANNVVVIGPLPTRREPYATELCQTHVAKFTAPLGWEVIRLASNFEPAPPSPDDILALAEVVREVSKQRVSDDRFATASAPSYTRHSPNHPSVLAAHNRARSEHIGNGNRPNSAAPREGSGPAWGPFSTPPPALTKQTGQAGATPRASSRSSGSTPAVQLRVISTEQ